MDTKTIARFQQLEEQLAEHADGSLFVQLAEAYLGGGEHERALAVLRRGLERHSGFAPAYAMMGRVLLDQQRYPEAQVTFERVLELDPTDQDAVAALERISAALRQSAATAPAAEPPAASAEGLMPWEEDALTPPAVAAADAPVPVATPSPEAELLKSNLLAVARTATAESEGKVDTTAIALADLLVGLLEYRDPFFRGGTSLTRLLTGAIGRELKLPPDEVNCYVLGAVLRDLGQVPLKGLISKPGEELAAARKRKVEGHVDTALEMLAAINLPESVRKSIRYHHERFDGSGYPEHLVGEAIPLGARIVAVADAFAAMISARPHRLPHSVPAALEEVTKTAGTQFDPAVVDALVRVLEGSDWRGLRFGLRHHVLIVDSDETRAMVLATKLCSNGYLAEAAFDGDTARERLNRTQIDGLIVSGELANDGAAQLLQEVRDNARLAMMPVLITDAGVTQRVPLLEAGGDVCLSKGSSFEEVKATLEAFFRREGKLKKTNKSAGTDWAGLQGDIQDFPLQWLMQVLNYDSRTAAIFLVTENEEGAIYVSNGNPKHARTKKLLGEEAFRHMLHWQKGSFTVDPDAKTEEHTIKTPLMNLLLDQAVQDDHAAFFGAVKT